jgi:hypothetical protein
MHRYLLLEGPKKGDLLGDGYVDWKIILKLIPK